MNRFHCKKLNSKNSDGLNPLGNNRGISTSDIIITVVAVIVIIVSTIFLVSNIITLNRVNQDIDEIKENIQAKQDTLNKLIELGKSEDMLREEYDRSELYIPSERGEADITSDVTSVVSDSNGRFNGLSFEDEINLENGITSIPFTIRVDCTYDELSAIIDSIGKTERLYIIESIVIVDAGSEDDNLVADINANAYYRKN